MLNPGQTIVAYEHNISQHRWPNIYKLWPNERNILAQYNATLLDATCCVCLVSLFQALSSSQSP